MKIKIKKKVKDSGQASFAVNYPLGAFGREKIPVQLVRQPLFTPRSGLWSQLASLKMEH
ncbi:MAG: hypothetical protein U0936_10965 [Planctomycetaceae bacterium]